MRRLLLPAIAALANAGSRGANGVALCGPDHIAIADSAADSVVILDLRRAEVVDIVPLPYGIFAHGVACLRQPTDHEPGVIIVTAQHGGHVFAAAYDEHRQHRLTTYAAWFASFRPNTTIVDGTYAVDAEPWRNMTHGPKGLALHDGVIYLPFESRNAIICVDAADIVQIVSAKFRERRRLALAENALVWVNATSARIFGHPRKPYALAFGPWKGVEALYVLGGDGVVVLNVTDPDLRRAKHAPVLATYATENMRHARALAVLGEKVYLLVTKGYFSHVESHAFSAAPYTVGVVGRGHGAGDGCRAAASFSRPHAIAAAAKRGLWVADMDNRAARSVDARGCTSTIPYRSLLRRFHARPAAATPNCSQQLVPTCVEINRYFSATTRPSWLIDVQNFDVHTGPDGRGGARRLRRPPALLGRGAAARGRRRRLGGRRLRVVLLAHRVLRRAKRALGRRPFSSGVFIGRCDAARVPKARASKSPRVLLRPRVISV